MKIKQTNEEIVKSKFAKTIVAIESTYAEAVQAISDKQNYTPTAVKS